MTDQPLPPPLPSATINTPPTQSPLTSPSKVLLPSGSPSNSIGTDSKSSQRPYRRSSKNFSRASFVALQKSPIPASSLDFSAGDSSQTHNTVPSVPLHSYGDAKSSSVDQINHNPNRILPDPQNPNHRQSLSQPLPPSKCPLLCVFYAEFDIVVGPMVCFQSPSKFMFFDINVGQNEINQSLEESFQSIMTNTNLEDSQTSIDVTQRRSNITDTIDIDDYWNWTTDEVVGNSAETESTQSTLPTSGHKSHRRKNTGTSTEHHHAATTGASLHEDSTVDSETLANSIFAACSEYIITGNELADQTITVSTRGMHILSRPMIISDTKRYERNSLLFSTGFVLRRDVDPRPWWPVLSNLSRTFRAMEVESEFLSNERTRPMIQTVLEDVLMSLNSKQIDCHLLLDDANLLNLQLFQPPPPPTPPVPDYAVPILLLPEWQLQLYDWDLTINWILPHIDGCKHVKQIADSSEVDMELVRSCLRVLKHHGVLSYVDIFRYCNVYECTPSAMQLLSNDSKERQKILDEGFWYAAKRGFVRQAPSKIYHEMLALTNGGSGNSPGSFSTSPMMSSVLGRRFSHSANEDQEPRSFNSHSRIAEESTSEEGKSSNPSSSKAMSPANQRNTFLRDSEMMKKILVELYCACTRDYSFGDILCSKFGAESNTPTSKADEKYHDISFNSLDSLTMGPLYEACSFEMEHENSHITSEQPERPHSSTSEFIDIDWSKAFNFDYRRMITFGVAHKLIRRVHQYPLACEVRNFTKKEDHTQRTSSLSQDYDASTSQLEFSAKLFDEHYQIIDDAVSAVTPTLSHSSLNGNDAERNSPGPEFKKTSLSFFEQVALSMDGTRCDDELSCMFETPIEELMEALKKSGRWNIMFVFSPDTI